YISCQLFISYFMLRQLPTPTHLPYATLFRSPPSASTRRSKNGMTPSWSEPSGAPSPPSGWASPRRGSPEHSSPCWEPSCCGFTRSEEHTSELQSRENLVCRLLLEKKKKKLKQ